MRKGLLKVSEFQRQLQISRGKAYQMIRSGEIPVVIITPRCLRIPQEAVEAYLERKLREGWSR